MVPKPSKERLLKIMDLGEEISTSYIAKALAQPTIEQQAEELTNLQMALSAAIGVMGAKFTTADPEEFADKVKTCVVAVMQMARAGDAKESLSNEAESTNEDDPWRS